MSQTQKQSTSQAVVVEPDLSLGARLSVVLSDVAELTKARIGSFVLITAFIGGLLAVGPGSGWIKALEAAFWILCVAASSGTFNQVLEIETDRLMPRTQNRPLVTGRMSVLQAVTIGSVLGIVGVAALAQRFNLATAFLALATLASYVLIYTPLKRTSSLNTVVGAIPGAMPPLLGYVALSGAVEGWAWMLFAILFAWQFPHFMAIAWLYREDYARADMQMLPAMPNTEGLAGRQALVYSLVLLVVSLLPILRGEAGLVYASGALVMGLIYAITSLRFALVENRSRARAVLFASLFYIPVVFSLVLMDPTVHRYLH